MPACGGLLRTQTFLPPYGEPCRAFYMPQDTHFSNQKAPASPLENSRCFRYMFFVRLRSGCFFPFISQTYSPLFPCFSVRFFLLYRKQAIFPASCFFLLFLKQAECVFLLFPKQASFMSVSFFLLYPKQAY